MAPLRLLVLLAVTATAAMLLTAGDDARSPLPAPPPLTVPGYAPAAPVAAAASAAPDPPTATLEAIAHCEWRAATPRRCPPTASTGASTSST